MADTGVIPDANVRTHLTFMRPSSQSVGADPDQPDYVSSDCEDMNRRSWLCRTFAEGTPAIETSLDTLLPKYTNEDDEDYRLRKKFASFRNFYAQACSSILGKMFAQPPQLKSDVPEVIAQELEDADLNGNHWTVVARSLTEAALNEGLSWIMVDFQNVRDVAGVDAENLTLEDEKKLGLRPYWVVIPQHQVLGVEYSYHGGIYRLTQFRYWTLINRKSGKFGEEWVTQIRVVEPGSIAVYELGTKKKRGKFQWEVVDLIVSTLNEVPVIPLNLNPKSRFTAVPPLENLAYMNLEHFQIRSDQRRSLSVASFPVLVSSGVQSTNTVKIGPMTSINFEDASAKMEWCESNGVHLKAGADELNKLECDMRTFGLSFENPQMYATATGRNIDASDAIAPIQFWAILLKDVLELALALQARWKKLPSGGSVDVNTSFLKNMLTVEGLKLLVEALKEGAISRGGFLQRMKEYGLLSDDFDVDSDLKDAIKDAEERAKLKAKEAPPKPAPGAEPPPPQQAT